MPLGVPSTLKQCKTSRARLSGWQGGDQLLNFLTEAGAVQPFLAEAPPGFGERHETELMHPEDRRGWSGFPACLRRIEQVNVPGGRFQWQVQGARKAPTAF